MWRLLSNRWYYWFIALVTFSAHTATGQVSQIFSLEDCLKYGFENHARVQNANLDREMAEAQIGETMADGLPQLNGYAEYSNYFNLQESFLPAIIFDPDAPLDQFVPVPFSQKYNSRASLDASQMIFDGSYFVGLKAAKTFKGLSEKDYIKSRQDKSVLDLC